eukprot:6172785-Pleurochrysis_carterae.AAC.2
MDKAKPLKKPRILRTEQELRQRGARLRDRDLGADCGSQNFRYSLNVTYCPIRPWESGDRMAPLIRHSPSTN